MAINTPRLTPHETLTPHEVLKERVARRERAIAQKVDQNEQNILMLRHDNKQLICRNEQLEHRIIDLERKIDAFLASTRGTATASIPVTTPPTSTRPARFTKKLDHFERWTTIHDLPSVTAPRLPDQVVEAAAGHEKRYSRHANVVYLNADNIGTLDKRYGIRDIIWGPHLIELRCDNTLTNDQILCVTEEIGDAQQQEATQKKPVVHSPNVLSPSSH